MTNLSTSSQDSVCTPSPPNHNDLEASCKLSKSSGYDASKNISEDTNSSYLGIFMFLDVEMLANDVVKE